MSDAQVRRVTAVAGIVAFVLYVASALLILDVPGIDATERTFANYVSSHGTPFLLEVILWGPIIAAAVTFYVGLWTILRRIEGEPGFLAMLFLASGLIVFAVVLGGFPALLVLGYRATALTPAEVRLLADFTFLGVALSAFPTILTTGAYAVLVLRTRALPGWTAWLALVVAALHVIAAVSFAPSGLLSPSGIGVYLAPPAFYIWVLAVSIVLLRIRADTAVVPAATRRGDAQA